MNSHKMWHKYDVINFQNIPEKYRLLQPNYVAERVAEFETLLAQQQQQPEIETVRVACVYQILGVVGLFRF